ncbi:MAG: hypothetical protein QOH96_3228 [Blastocatellia bacterium]|jgi:hypothetical protein|nr:hypothetical protein [Blastocatellia bacterium]
MDSLSAEGLFAEETLISTENLVLICGKSDSGCVRRIVHVCCLRTDVSDFGMTITWDTH